MTDVAPEAPTKVTRTSTPASESGPASQSAVSMLLDVIEEIGRENAESLMRMKPSKIHTQMYYRCRIKSYKASGEITAYYSQQILAGLSSIWRGTPVWDYLSTLSKQPSKPPELIDVNDIPNQLVRRNKSHQTVSKTTASTPDDSSELPSRKGLKNPQPPMVGRRSGKAAVLRLATSSKKRYRDAMEDDDSISSSRGRKTAKASHMLNDDEDDDDTDDGATQEDQERDSEDDSAAPTKPQQPVRIMITAEKVPSMSPSGPSGTWTCDEPGCGAIVRAADQAEGKEAIALHFREHEEQHRKIDIALAEGSHGHLPIKYAYFPPYLLLVHIREPSTT